MVERVQLYRASCGRTFDTLEEAERHEVVDGVLRDLSAHLVDGAADAGGALDPNAAAFVGSVLIARARGVSEALSRLPKAN